MSHDVCRNFSPLYFPCTNPNWHLSVQWAQVRNTTVLLLVLLTPLKICIFFRRCVLDFILKLMVLVFQCSGRESSCLKNQMFRKPHVAWTCSSLSVTCSDFSRSQHFSTGKLVWDCHHSLDSPQICLAMICFQRFNVSCTFLVRSWSKWVVSISEDPTI